VRRLRVFEDGMLRRILKLKKQEVTVGWRPLHNGSDHNPCSSSDILEAMKCRRALYEGRLAVRGDER